MIRFALVPYLFIVLSVAGWTQNSAPQQAPGAPARISPLAKYVGTWTGSLEGRVWLTVKLTQQGQQLSGSLQRPANLQFNDQGDVKSVSDDKLVETVEEAVLNGDGLLLSVKNRETQQTDRFTMRVSSDTTAELKMSAMSMPPGMPKPKPWKLTKVPTAAPAAH